MKKLFACALQGLRSPLICEEASSQVCLIGAGVLRQREVGCLGVKANHVPERIGHIPRDVLLYSEYAGQVTVIVGHPNVRVRFGINEVYGYSDLGTLMTDRALEDMANAKGLGYLSEGKAGSFQRNS